MEELEMQLPAILAKLASLGWVGLAVGAVIGIIYFLLNRRMKKMARQRSDKKQASDMASNAGENSQADRDAASAEGSIEDIINSERGDQ